MISKKLKPYGERVCEDCRCFELLDKENIYFNDNYMLGFCKRRSPVLLKESLTMFPIVKHDCKICGEYITKY